MKIVSIQLKFSSGFLHTDLPELPALVLEQELLPRSYDFQEFGFFACTQ